MSNKSPRVEKIESFLDRFGNTAVESFHYIALFIIGCMVIWSAAHTVFDILTVKQYATIDDILLLFIYLELGAMVGIYFKTTKFSDFISRVPATTAGIHLFFPLYFSRFN